MKQGPLVILSTLIAAVVTLTNCRKESFIEDSSAKLAFSTDTVLFDTVFTTVGSTTHNFKIYNKHDKRIEIGSIELAGGENSQFRMNVDGVPADQLENVEIPPNDSLFAFIEVTVDPNNKNKPMIVEDSVIFRTNGNRQQVKLAAWGQDAHFHQNVLTCNATWSSEKPHVIYGTVAVDTACSLTIEAGTPVHVHPNSRLVVLKDGKLDVNGTADNKVVFQGDRLEPIYDDEPGQWERIWLIESKGSEIDHAIIKNSIIGLQVDTVGDASVPAVTLNNTIIWNASKIGLLGQAGAYIEANNSLFYNCGEFTTALTSGGQYQFKHCTFANYWDFTDRETPSFLMNNYFEDANENKFVRPLTNTDFYNCIFTGSLDNEFVTDMESGEPLDFTFHNSLFTTEQSTGGPEYQDPFRNEAPGFVDPDDRDFHLSDGAFPIDKGMSVSGISADLDGNPRDADPDLGAYEKQ